ncbi:MAG: Na+/H+ antiporter subunit E [Ottowia sp.]|nr:Na+/H+ antiporter subunit E [Ottowia sp.]MBQ9578181.1 Na+/H+ antiporter subunit E [Ottowia sp.]
MMRRLLPAPLLSCVLAACWLALTRSVDAAQVLLALIFALALPAMFAPLRPSRARVAHLPTLLLLMARVAGDVVSSNLAVLRSLLLQRRRPPRSAFVLVPLELRDPSALAALALITAIVPGTVWCELARDCSALLLHVWDLPEGGEAALIAQYKTRYERPLQRIFESRPKEDTP